MTTNKNNVSIDGDKTRRKRLKVVSACGECRRKKTKCNGEKPCAGCLKAHVECKYVFTQKSNTSTTNNVMPSSVITTTTTTTAATAPINHNSSNNNIIIEDKPCSNNSSVTTTTSSSSIESIEERLGAIENILRALLGSGKNKHLLQGLQQQQQNDSDNLLCGDMYSSSTSPHLVHAPHIQNRSLTREKRKRHDIEEKEDLVGVTAEKRLLIRDDFGHGYDHHHHHQYNNNKLQLAPIKIINHHQSSSSYHSPGTPTIRNLLNNNHEDNTMEQEKSNNNRWYPTNRFSSVPPPPTSNNNNNNNSAFYRMSSSPRIPNNNSNTATTAAGTLS